MTTINPNSLFQNLNQQGFPPVDLWDPPYCGEIDICIHKNGSWSYQGSEFKRQRLVKLFSKVLKREGDDYFLVTPVEKVKIQVEAEPFITTRVEQSFNKEPAIAFNTNLDETVLAGPEHLITVIENANKEPYPTIHIRNNLHALISRSDFYQLVEWSDTIEHNGKTICTVHSLGKDFVLGKY